MGEASALRDPERMHGGAVRVPRSGRGLARVISSPAEIDQVHDGEILLAPLTCRATKIDGTLCRLPSNYN